MAIKNGDVVNLDIYEEDDLFNRTVIITKDITDITLTSNRKSCDFRVFVKKRNSDLNININNLILNSKDEVAINFASGKDYNYKSYLNFSGINTISSEENIAICITNNQTVVIRGDKDSFLKVNGGSGVPAIGSSFYTEGAGNIIFSGEGSVEIIAGKSDTREESRKILNSGCGIGFYNEDVDDVSSIKVLDNIDLKIVGEDGIDIESISQDKVAGKGGYGIEIKNSGIFEKKGNGLLEIRGGNGGSLVGDYSAGVCGDGGCAISLGQGNINIDNKAILKAGHGGGVKNEYEFPMVKGGNGGDIVSILQDDLEDVSTVRMGNAVEVILGNGGNSGTFIKGKDIKGFNGGNSGSLINSNNNKVKVKIGDISIKEAIGGLGGNKEDVNNKGEDGKIQKQYLGDNIEFIDFKEELEDMNEVENKKSFLKDIEESQVANDSEGCDTEKEEINNLNIESKEINKNLDVDKDLIENLKEVINGIIKDDLEVKASNEIIEENIVDIEKNEDIRQVFGDEIDVRADEENIGKDNNRYNGININKSENFEDSSEEIDFTENKDLENNTSDEEKVKEDTENNMEKNHKKSIWEKIKEFFKEED